MLFHVLFHVVVSVSLQHHRENDTQQICHLHMYEITMSDNVLQILGK